MDFKCLPKNYASKPKSENECILAKFIHHRKDDFMKGKLSKEKQEILESLGVVFNKKDSLISHEF
jgi:hypothetical protein